jgi:TolB-like protein/Flp pilus assembly protein TadD
MISLVADTGYSDRPWTVNFLLVEFQEPASRMPRVPIVPTKGHNNASSNRLDSWKEIASYLDRKVRTVNLWEKMEGLPVHRHQHSKRGTVYALKSEIDAWRQRRVAPESPRQAKRKLGGDHRHTHMIAVLPFKNLSDDPSQTYFSDGFTEEMISQLGRVSPERIGVIARTSSMHYKTSDRTVSDIGQELGVDLVLEGSVQRSGERVRISARLSEVQNQSTLWSETYDRQLADIFNLQTAVAGEIAKSIVEQLNPTMARPFPVPQSRSSVEAYEAYFKGRQYWNQRTEESLLKSVHYFTRAIEQDPALALGYSGLADAYNILSVYGSLPPHEAMPLAKAAAMRALEINPQLGEAHAALGDIKFSYEWEWEAAKAEYELATALNPSYATAHHFYGYCLAAMGDHDHAIAKLELAREFDPHSVVIRVWKAIILRLADRPNDAIAACRDALKVDANFVLAHWAMGLAYEQQEQFRKASTELELAVRLSGRNPGMLSSLGHAQAMGGNRRKAEQTLEQLLALSEKRYVPAYDLAIVYVGLGNKIEALKCLDKAVAERCSWLVTLPLEPRLSPLRQCNELKRLSEQLSIPSVRSAQRLAG